MGQIHAYQFEAKGVQRYLFASGRLRDLIGASDLVSRIAFMFDPEAAGGGTSATAPDDLVGAVLRDLDLKCVPQVTTSSPVQEVSFSRRAGASFCLHGSESAMKAVRGAVRQRVMTALPGLEVADSLGIGPDEITSAEDARKNGGGQRANALASVLPLGRPVMRVAPQTGLPAVAALHYGDGDTFLTDAITDGQRRWGDILQNRMIDGSRQGSNRFVIDGVAQRFHHFRDFVDPDGRELPLAYPRRYESDEGESGAGAEDNPLFPFAGSDRRVGYVHADLSGLGEGFAQFKRASAQQALEMGAAIEKAVIEAAREANADVLLKASMPDGFGKAIAPVRPVVIGGDDLTFIVRADLALPFAERLLQLLEAHTLDLLGGLSACAGIAIINKSVPFLTANALAESLCKHAKKKAKEKAKEGVWPSLLSFHIQTQSAEEDYGDIGPTLITPDGRLLSNNPYAANLRSAARTGAPEFGKLLALASSIREFRGSAGTLRQIKGELANGKTGVARGLWRRLLTRPDLGDQEQAAQKAFEAAVEAILASKPVSNDVPDCGAIFDALGLIDIKAIPTCVPPPEVMEAAA